MLSTMLLISKYVGFMFFYFLYFDFFKAVDPYVLVSVANGLERMTCLHRYLPAGV